MLKNIKSKAFYIMSIAIMLILSSACFAAINWSYIIECTNSLNEITIGVFNKTGLACVRFDNS